MKPKKLSKEMIKCLDKMQTESSLFRTNGGLWTGKDVPMVQYGMDQYPEWFFGKGTIEALIERGLMMVWNTKDGKYGVFTVEVKLSLDYNEKIKLYKYGNNATDKSGANDNIPNL